MVNKADAIVGRCYRSEQGADGFGTRCASCATLLVGVVVVELRQGLSMIEARKRIGDSAGRVGINGSEISNNSVQKSSLAGLMRLDIEPRQSHSSGTREAVALCTLVLSSTALATRTD